MNRQLATRKMRLTLLGTLVAMAIGTSSASGEDWQYKPRMISDGNMDSPPIAGHCVGTISEGLLTYTPNNSQGIFTPTTAGKTVYDAALTTPVSICSATIVPFGSAHYDTFDASATSAVGSLANEQRATNDIIKNLVSLQTTKVEMLLAKIDNEILPAIERFPSVEVKQQIADLIMLDLSHLIDASEEQQNSDLKKIRSELSTSLKSEIIGQLCHDGAIAAAAFEVVCLAAKK
jgi:hypothetical protein